jgi:hypothetical protein
LCYNDYRNKGKEGKQMSRKQIKNITKELSDNKKEQKELEKLIKKLLTE